MGTGETCNCISVHLPSAYLVFSVLDAHCNFCLLHRDCERPNYWSHLIVKEYTLSPLNVVFLDFPGGLDSKVLPTMQETQV